MKVRSTIAAMVLMSASGFAAAQAPDVTPLELTEVARPDSLAAPQFGDIAFGTWGSWVGSDVTSGRLLWMNSRGTIVNSYFLGVDAIALYPTAGTIFFAGPDSSLVPQYGGVYYYGPGFRSMTAQLPSNFLSQGTSLTGSPNGFGVVISRSLSEVFWFKKDYTTTPVIRTLTLPPRVLDWGPGGNYYIGTSAGVQVLTPAWTFSAIPNYTANVTAIRGCGDSLWTGGLDYLDWWQDNGDGYLKAQFKRFGNLGGSTISSIDCGQGGTAIAVGSNRMIFFVDPAASVVHAFQAPGTSNFVKISGGPGLTPSGLILDNFGNLASFNLSPTLQYSSGRNSSPNRLLSFTIRNF